MIKKKVGRSRHCAFLGHWTWPTAVQVPGVRAAVPRQLLMCDDVKQMIFDISHAPLSLSLAGYAAISIRG